MDYSCGHQAAPRVGCGKIAAILVPWRIKLRFFSGSNIALNNVPTVEYFLNTYLSLSDFICRIINWWVRPLGPSARCATAPHLNAAASKQSMVSRNINKGNVRTIDYWAKKSKPRGSC